MTNLLLDADVLIDLLRERKNASDWLLSLSSFPVVSGIAALEISYGAQDGLKLQQAELLLSKFSIIYPTEQDIKRAIGMASLKLTHGIGADDAVTAALALRCNLPLATFNVKHFRSVPGLKIVQPYER